MVSPGACVLPPGGPRPPPHPILRRRLHLRTQSGCLSPGSSPSGGVGVCKEQADPRGGNTAPPLGPPGCWSTAGHRGSGTTHLWDGGYPASPPPPSAPPAQGPLVSIPAGEASLGKEKHRLCEENVTHQAWAAALAWSNQPNDFIAPETSCERQEDGRQDLFCLERAVKKAALKY